MGNLIGEKREEERETLAEEDFGDLEEGNEENGKKNEKEKEKFPMFEEMLEKAKQGDCTAQIFISASYRVGLGCRRNGKHAAEWIRKAYKSDNSLALAFQQYYGIGGAKRDLEIAHTMFDKILSSKSLSKVERILALNGKAEIRLKGGNGIKKDRVLSFSLYEQSAQLGSVAALSVIGAFLFRDKKYKEAFEKLTDAVEKGAHASLSPLGECYYNGFHVEKDVNLAIKLWRKAVSMGIASAMKHLISAREKFPPTEEDLKTELSLFEELGETDKEAKLILGKLFWEGIHVKKDIELAAKYFHESVSVKESKENLKILLEETELSWRPKYHIYFPRLELVMILRKRLLNKEGEKSTHKKKNVIRLDEQILTVLLVSKHRNQSNLPQADVFNKVVSMNVIKHLANSWRNDTL